MGIPPVELIKLPVPRCYNPPTVTNRGAYLPRQWYGQYYDMPPSPERTEKIFRKLTTDANALRVAPVELMPPELRDAFTEFDRVAAMAEQAIAEFKDAQARTAATAKADIEATTAALREGKPAPKPARAKVAEAEEAAAVKVTALEPLIMDAHMKVTEAAREHHDEWRRAVLERAPKARATALKELDEAAAAVADYRDAYLRVLSIDRQVSLRHVDQPEWKPVADSLEGIHETRNRLVGPQWQKVEEALQTLRDYLEQEIPWAQE